MRRLLLVEDEEVILKALRRLLERNHYDVQCATSVDQAREHDLHSFDLILADLRLPGDLGTSLIAVADPVPVIIMTSHASVRSAVDAMRHGAIDYIAKPFDHDELLMIIKRSLNQNLMQAQNRALKIDLARNHPIDVSINNSVLATLLDKLTASAEATRFIHLYGEYGTEKESLCRALHMRCEQRDGPFLVLDTAREEAPESSALLGPVSGLPAGGYVQAAQNGTLVVRNPEWLSLDSQKALYQAVTGQNEVGSQALQRRTANLSLTCISEHSIADLIADGRMCPELGQLFEDSEFEVPPLRTRPADITSLVEAQLKRLSPRYGRKLLKVNDHAKAALLANDWPGNVHELHSVLQRAVFNCRTHTISLPDLCLSLDSGSDSMTLDSSSSGVRDMSLDEYFRFFVIHNQRALSETELASRLGISRKALWERRQKMGLSRDALDDPSTAN